MVTEMDTKIFNMIPADINRLPHPAPEFAVVSGSWHDMGKQYAQQAKEVLSIRVAEMLGDYIDIFGSYENVVNVISGYLEASRQDFPQFIELLGGMGEVLGLAPEICAILLYGKSMIRVEMESCLKNSLTAVRAESKADASCSASSRFRASAFCSRSSPDSSISTPKEARNSCSAMGMLLS